MPADPSQNQGHVDQMLTNISVGFMQEATAFIAGDAFPVVPVQHASDVYWIYPRDAFYRDDVGYRPIGGYSPETGHELDEGTYRCKEEGLTAWIDDRERANATGPFDPDRSKTKLLMSQHMIHRDNRFVSNFMTTGLWTSDVTGVASAPGGTQEIFWSLGTSNPSKTIRSRKRSVKRKTGYEPNVLILGSDVEIDLCQHPDFIDRVKFTNEGALEMDLVQAAKYFGVGKVKSATGIQTTSDEGQAYTSDFIVGPKDALLVYAAPEPGLEVPSGGYIFAWTGLLGDQAATPSVVYRGREERRHSDWIEARTAYDMKIVAPDLGVFFHNIVQ